MTYLRLYHDGTSSPELEDNQLVLLVMEGRLSAIQYNREISQRERRLVGNDVYLNPDLLTHLRDKIMTVFPDVFVKRHPVYLLLPPDLQDDVLNYGIYSN